MREKIREEDGKVYGINAYPSLNKLPYNRSLINIYFTSEVDQRDGIIDDVKKVMESLKSGYEDEKELVSAKMSKKVALEKNYQKPTFWLNELSSSLLYETKFYNFQECINLVDSVTLEDIKEISNLVFNFDNVIIGSNKFTDSNLSW